MVRGVVISLALLLGACTLPLNGFSGRSDAGPPMDGGDAGETVDAGPAPCGPANCDGCCQENECLPGTARESCGIGGSLCSVCPAVDTCEAGACSGCNATTCATGCCQGSACTVPRDSACGIGGAACVPCGADRSCLADGMCSACPFLEGRDGTCKSASNLGDVEVAGCDATAPRLEPTGGGVIFTGTSIDCTADCGDGITSIPVTVTPGAPARVCLSSVSIASDIRFDYDQDGATEGLILIVDGDVSIAGEIIFSGAGGLDGDRLNQSGGPGGPGGDRGGDGRGANQDGEDGQGPGGGGGGDRNGGTDTGGGGGGGFGGSGGDGGDGSGGTPAGNGGGSYGTVDLVPLIGGSGGGGGGEGGGSGVDAASSGGGGGGALQISARGTIRVEMAGRLLANGGDGGDSADNNTAGGGGGSGGGVLLEAASVVIDGRVEVEGGDGGDGEGENGGRGGRDGRIDGNDGRDADGGSGGGGGGGRVRINSVDGSPCANVSPADACSSGAL